LGVDYNVSDGYLRVGSKWDLNAERESVQMCFPGGLIAVLKDCEWLWICSKRLESGGELWL